MGRSVDETSGSYDSRCTCQLSQTEIKPGSPGENKPSHKATQGQPLGWPIISDIEKSPADLWRWGHSLLHYSEFLLELRAVSIQMRENSPCQLITDTDNKIIPSQNKTNIELFNNLTAGLYLILFRRHARGGRVKEFAIITREEASTSAKWAVQHCTFEAWIRQVNKKKIIWRRLGKSTFQNHIVGQGGYIHDTHLVVVSRHIVLFFFGWLVV